MFVGVFLAHGLELMAQPGSGSTAPSNGAGRAENRDAALDDVRQWISDWEERQEETPSAETPAQNEADVQQEVQHFVEKANATAGVNLTNGPVEAGNNAMDNIGLNAPSVLYALDSALIKLDSNMLTLDTLPPPPAVDWLDLDLATAYADAASSGKPILVKFTATWCAPCRLLEEQTFSDSTVADYVNNHMIPLSLDMESDFDGIALAEYHMVKALPTVLVLDAQGGLEARFTGMFGPTVFLERFRGY